MNAPVLDKTDLHTPYKHLRLAYILISIVLCLPVLLWPLPVLIFENPMLPDLLLPTWMLCIALLLITSVAMDSMLYGLSSFKQVIDATLWVGLFAMIVISTLQKQEGAWLFAALFLIHSIRASFHLLRQHTNNAWWLWLAWARDITAAICILLWNSALTL